MVEIKYKDLIKLLGERCVIQDNPTIEPLIINFRDVRPGEELKILTYDSAHVDVTIAIDTEEQMVSMEFY